MCNTKKTCVLTLAQLKMITGGSETTTGTVKGLNTAAAPKGLVTTYTDTVTGKVK